MRLLTLLFILVAAPVSAEIRSADDCTAAIAAAPERAREDAARWAVLGGGAEAKACEARALEALGARKTAAVILTEVAAAPGNGLGAVARAAMFRDAARLWLAVEEPRLAEETISRILALTAPDADTLALRAEARGRQGDWAAAQEDLARALALSPGRADLLTLQAAARRRSGDATGGLAAAEAALAALPSNPEALFEKGANLAVLGRVPEALEVWFALIELDPDGEMAELARRNIRQLSGN